MPKLNSLFERTSEDNITQYYNSSSIYIPNKYHVGLFGENVGKAINTMNSVTRTDDFFNRSKAFKGQQIYADVFNNWLSRHFTSPSEVELKWTCSKVTVPHPKPNYEEGYSIDAIKPIKYSLLKDYGGPGVLTLTIADTRNMLMYQFFNALMNEFFSARILKPKSSFQKLGIYVAAVNGDYLQNTQGLTSEQGDKLSKVVDMIPLHVFEFNSIVPLGMSEYSFSNDAKSPATFTVSFKVPNTFQEPFKTTFRGLRDNTSDRQFTDAGVDRNYMVNGGYNESAFTMN